MREEIFLSNKPNKATKKWIYDEVIQVQTRYLATQAVPMLSMKPKGIDRSTTNHFEIHIRFIWFNAHDNQTQQFDVSNKSETCTIHIEDLIIEV